MIPYYRTKLGLSIAGVVLGAAATGANLCLITLTPDDGAVIKLALLVLACAAVCGLSTWCWTDLVSRRQFAESEWHFMNREARRRRPEEDERPALPEDVDVVAGQILELMMPLGQIVAEVTAKERQMRDRLGSMAQYLQQVETERDALRIEAAKVHEIAAVAARRYSPDPEPIEDERVVDSGVRRDVSANVRAPDFLRRPRHPGAALESRGAEETASAAAVREALESKQREAM